MKTEEQLTTKNELTSEETQITVKQPSEKKQGPRKLTLKELQERKLEMASQPGTYVVKGLSFESRALIRLLNEYDIDVSYIKRIIGRPGTDQERALKLIEKCIKFETDFMDLVKELTNFVKSCKKANFLPTQSL